MLETDLPTISKRARVLSGNNNSGQDLRTTNPSYIEYNGTYFHISEFLSIQQGKVYMPSTSRNARWMAVSKVNYYDNIDKIAPSPNQEDMHCRVLDGRSTSCYRKGSSNALQSYYQECIPHSAMEEGRSKE